MPSDCSMQGPLAETAPTAAPAPAALRQRRQSLLAALFWIALLITFVCANVPTAAAPHLTAWDKANHFIAFFVLSVLAAAAFPRRGLGWIGVGLSAFGALIEIVQLIPALHRDPEFGDWVADTLAIVVVLLPIALVRWRDVRSGIIKSLAATVAALGQR